MGGGGRGGRGGHVHIHYTAMFYAQLISTDVNECEESNDCADICINRLGSYECMCSQGFMLLEDGRNCQRKSVSSTINDLCSYYI